MKKRKMVQLPCTDNQYKIIKMYCLINGLKYADITKILIDIIEGNNSNDTNRGNSV